MTDPSRPPTTLYVGNLPPQATSTTLSEAFIPFGEVNSVSLPKPEAPSSTDLHRGFGYVEFEDATDAKEALDNMDQSELYGRTIKVALAKPDRREGEGKAGTGSLVAVWEQEGYLAQHATSEEDRAAVQQSRNEVSVPEDPMQGLEGLDVAGPRLA